MKELCHACNKKPHTKICDHAVGSGIYADLKEIPTTCDMFLCDDCATSLWNDCDLCPEHTQEVKKKLNGMMHNEIKHLRNENNWLYGKLGQISLIIEEGRRESRQFKTNL